MRNNKFKVPPRKIVLTGNPEPKQIEFMMAHQKYVAYGGARGGGKSWALRRKLVLLGLNYPGIRMLLLRRQYVDLLENHLVPFRTEISPKDDEKPFAIENKLERSIEFIDGSRLKFGYLDNDSDLDSYRGQEYDIIAIDEATQFSEYEFRMLGALIRGGNPEHPKRFYLTCNPGGQGHAWVKRLFIDKKYNPGENPDDYVMIRAYFTDNPHNGSEYESMLDILPGKMREADKYGSWDVFSGQYFTEWNSSIHVIPPFEIPNGWRRYFVQDYGLDMLAGLWIAVDYNGNAYVYREVYQSDLKISEASQIIKSMEQIGESIDQRLAPTDLWSSEKVQGKTIIEHFSDNGLYFTRADRSRVNGWMAVHEWLRVFEDAGGNLVSRLKFFKTCENIIRTLPLLQYDKDGNDVNKKGDHELSHAPDALRYWAISRPASAIQTQKEPLYPFEEMQRSYNQGKNPFSEYGFGISVNISSYLGDDW